MGAEFHGKGANVQLGPGMCLACPVKHPKGRASRGAGDRDSP